MLLHHHTQYNQALSNKINPLAHYLSAAWSLVIVLPQSYCIYQNGWKAEARTSLSCVKSLLGGIIAIELGSSVIKGILKKPSKSVKESIENSQTALHALADKLKKITPEPAPEQVTE